MYPKPLFFAKAESWKEMGEILVVRNGERPKRQSVETPWSKKLIVNKTLKF